MTLEIKDLHVEVEGIEILKGITSTFEPNKFHALMGPNGSGKSTLAHTLMGHPKYKITKGKIMLDGKDITHEKAHLRAKAGLFLSFQYPAEVAGVTINNFLRTAYNTVKEKNLSVLDFHKLLKEKMELLHMDASFSKRHLNQGFSGGEKKRAEILQMIVLEPKYAILDEPDSGTDVDALKKIGEGINLTKQKVKTGIILITHHNKILNYVKPDQVIIVVGGKVVDQGDARLAQEIEKSGYQKYTHEPK